VNGSALRRECEARDLTLTQLARLAGLRRETLSRAVAGRRVTENTLQRIAAVLRRVPVLERDPISASLIADAAVPATPVQTKARGGITSSRPQRSHGRARERVPADV
jgi:transcriptional regulator with XRE-family HTH domain